LLTTDCCSLGASLLRAVVDSTKSMSSLVRNNLPLRGSSSSNNDVCATHSFYALCRGLTITSRAAVCRVCRLNTSLTKPCETNCASSIACTEQCPVAVGILLISSPCAEQIETILNIDAIATCLVPSTCRVGCSRTIRVRDGQVGQAE
jgi:hypothetical protein